MANGEQRTQADWDNQEPRYVVKAGSMVYSGVTIDADEKDPEVVILTTRRRQTYRVRKAAITKTTRCAVRAT